MLTCLFLFNASSWSTSTYSAFFPLSREENPGTLDNNTDTEEKTQKTSDYVS